MPDPKLYLLFTAITALAVLIQAGLLLGIALGAREAKKKVMEALDEVRQKALPVLEQSRVILTDAAPKIKTITDDLVETTAMLKKQATRVDGAVDDVLSRTRHQVARVDAMIGGSLDAVQHATNSVHNTVSRAGETLQHAIDVPTRQISGVVNAITSAVNRMRQSYSPSSRASTATRYRKVPVSSRDVAAAGRQARPDPVTEPLVPPGI